MKMRANMLLAQRTDDCPARDFSLDFIARISSPMLLTLTRKIRVEGFRKMGTFGKHFPANKPDHSWPTPPPSTLSANASRHRFQTSHSG